MIFIGDIISILRPEYEYTVFNNSYEQIDWKGNDPVPYEEFFEAYRNYEQLKEQEALEKEYKKQQALEKLSNLGLTAEDIKSVLE